MTIIDTIKILALAAAVAGAPVVAPRPAALPDLGAMLATGEGMAMARITFATRTPVAPYDSLQALR